MRSTVFGGNDVMNKVSRRKLIRLQTFFAQWVLGKIEVTQDTPAVIISAEVIWSTNCGIIFTVHNGFMFGTISSLTNYLGTAGVSTGFKRLLRHKKAPFKRTGMNGKQGENTSSTISFISF